MCTRKGAAFTWDIVILGKFEWNIYVCLCGQLSSLDGQRKRRSVDFLVMVVYPIFLLHSSANKKLTKNPNQNKQGYLSKKHSCSSGSNCGDGGGATCDILYNPTSKFVQECNQGCTRMQANLYNHGSSTL